MKKTKIFFAVFFVAALAFMISLLSYKAPTDATDGFYTYTIADGKATIKACDVSISGNVTLPSKLGDHPVVSIGRYAFDSCVNITSLVIPEGITEIQTYAFENCNQLKEIHLPNSLSIIDNDAFSNCSSLNGIYVNSGNTVYSNDTYGVLYSKDKTTLIRAPLNLADPYVIPDSVKAIGDRAFFGCKNLKNITIPDGITGIDWYTFSNCTNLTTIVIPKSLTSIGYEVFRGCTNLATVYYKGSAEDWSALVIKNGNTSFTDAKVTYNFCSHLWDSGVITKEPTCKESGIRTYSCTLCTSTKMEAIAKLSTHTWNEGITTKAPTCNAEGVKTFTCTICNTTRTESIAKLATHTFNSGVTTKEPTCKDTGIMTYTCRICGVTKEEAIDMLTTHTPGDPATATTDQVCTVCGKVLVPATGEEPTEPETTEPTEPSEPSEDNGGGGFFGGIINFFNSIGTFFENLFASITSLFGG